MMRTQSIFLVTLVALVLSPAVVAVSASSNLGLLRVASFICPRQVAPGASFIASLDAQYALQGLPNNATIRGAIYPGNDNSSNPLWQSDPTSVSNGGDQVWNVSLTAPSTEGFLNLTAYALFLDNGTWRFFNDPVSGPGVSHLTIKIGKSANLIINIGAPNAAVTVGNTTVQTSANGQANLRVAVGSSPLVGVPPTVEFQNSTRIVFVQWSDGDTQPQRHVLIDGDTALNPNYKTQYLLTVTTNSTTEAWYDKGSNATITAPSSTSGSWPLNLFGVTQTFSGWAGDVHSSMPRLNVTMDSPKVITANYAVDYLPLAVPVVFGVGIALIVIGIVLVIRRRSIRSPPPAEEPVQEAVEQTVEKQNPPTCPKCGQETEPDWAHCIKCGTKL